MLTDTDRLRLQAGFDGELSAEEWLSLQEAFRDSLEARAFLAELERLDRQLDAAAPVPVPAGLAEAIKAQIPDAAPAAGDNVTRVEFGASRRGSRPAINWAGGLALAASLVLAVGLGVQFMGVSELGMDSEMRSRMTGTLLDDAATDGRQHWRWPGMDARTTLTRSDTGLALEIEANAETAAELVLRVSSDQWRWRQDAASAALETGRGAASEPLRLAVDGKQRYRLVLEPVTRDGETAQGPLPVPRVGIAVQRDGHLIDQGVLVPD